MRSMLLRSIVAAVSTMTIVAAIGPAGVSAAEPGSAAEPRSLAESQAPADDRVEQLKKEVLDGVDARRVFIQRMVDTQFSFSELGFQEFETQRYLTGILEREGFEIELGTAGMPSGWLARWGSGTTGDRARQRRRRHPEVFADARRGVPPAADRGGAGARRGSQLGVRRSTSRRRSP